MSVTKSSSHIAYKDTAWLPERVSVFIVRMILSGIIFFIILSFSLHLIDTRNYFQYFLYLLGAFFISDVLAFFLSYAIVKLLFGLVAHRKVKSFLGTIKHRKRIKKLWISIFTLSWKAIFFMVSFIAIVADMIPLPTILAYICAWIALWISAKVLGRFLYFVFYTF